MHQLAARVGIAFASPATQLSGVADTVYEEVAFGPMNLGLPRRRGDRADRRCARLPADRGARRPRPGPPLGRPAAAGGDRRAARPAAAPPGPRRADRPARSGRDGAGRRCARRPARATGPRSSSRSTRPTCWRGSARGSWCWTRGGSSLDGPAGDVLADPRLDRPGRAPPAAVRLERAAGGGATSARPADAPQEGARPMTELALDGGQLSLPGWRHAGARRGRPAHRGRASGSRWSARTAAARRPWCATSTDCCGPPPVASCMTAGTSPWRSGRRSLPRSVGLVFQDPDRQIFAGSVRSRGRVRAAQPGHARRRAAAAVDEALAAVGLDGRVAHQSVRPGHSRRKLLTIASVLAMRTPVVVLDEPTTGQDPRGVAIVRRAVDEAHAAGRTVIAISHDMGFVADAFDRVVVLRGRPGGARRDPGIGLRRAVLGGAALDLPRAAAASGHRRSTRPGRHADRLSAARGPVVDQPALATTTG